MFRQYGDEFLSGEMSNASRYLRFKPTEDEKVLKALRTWLILYNPPNFTNLTCKLYSDRDGLPGALIATSTTSYNKEQLLLIEDYGTKGIPFTFDPVISLSPLVYYHFVLNCTGYTYDYNAHLSWRKAWPDPVYGNATFAGLLRSTYMAAIIGADL